MRIYEITGQQLGTTMKVVGATPNKVELLDPQTQARTTFDPSKNPNAIQQGPEGITVNPNADPNAKPEPPKLQQGSEVNVVGAPGAMSPNPGAPAAPAAPGAPAAPAAPGTPPEQGGQQNAQATEDFDEDPIGKLEKEFKSLNEPLDEAAYITRLAQRVAGVSVLNKQTVNQDVLNLKKLAGI
jgi:hypothetical protein